MTPTASNDWRGVRADRLDELLDAHTRMGGTGAGRRYRTEQLNLALIGRLAGEFQGFARDLHNEAIEYVYLQLAASNAVWADVAQDQRNWRRSLDRRNATPSTLNEDFARFGMELWPALRSRDRRNTQRQHHLEHLNQARNAIAHASTAGFQKLASTGIRLDLAAFKQWRAAVDQIAVGMDVAVAEHLAAMFNTPVPKKQCSAPFGGAGWLTSSRLAIACSCAPLREIEARVLEVYGTNDSQLLLAVPLHGSEGEVLSEETISMPIRRVIRRLAVA